ncbi:uncharacterized protein LOC133886843 isoform X3 [Phragmites australis]|uniref:uncharacterized protein LOC133886843 isoform X3 n=1 Tax=Phragmites australis TaxID=29695 RepID=UPI002D7673C3|nr:uncharacterized protein LOC133886843 isoform X3 [Phragmites australis]XP_062182711.1 uncharacterized protein LOC133886843 isoform X3 [Phragmites australis]
MDPSYFSGSSGRNLEGHLTRRSSLEKERQPVPYPGARAALLGGESWQAGKSGRSRAGKEEAWSSASASCRVSRWRSCNRCRKLRFLMELDINAHTANAQPPSSRTDSTDEAEFVLFGDMGCQLVRKDVRLLMRSSRTVDAIPSEIASLVSQKYQFTVNVTSKCFEKPQRSYEVKHIHCAYGRQPTIPTIKRSTDAFRDEAGKAILPIAYSSGPSEPHKVHQVEISSLPQNVKDTPPPKDSPNLTALKNKQPPLSPLGSDHDDTSDVPRGDTVP